MMIALTSHRTNNKSSLVTSSSSFKTLVPADMTDDLVPDLHKESSYTEAHGDYQSEAFLEDPNLPLYVHQRTLPRLPVPSLEETVQTLVPTVLPFVTNQQERVDLEQALRSFPQQAKILQERLLQRKQEFADSSWLQSWWNQLGYLQCRDALFHISYYYRLADDDSCPPGDGLMRAACVLQAAAFYARDLTSGQKEPEVLGRKQMPLCSTQYKYLFSTCRIPGEAQDSFRIYEPTWHVVVACRGQFFKMSLVDEYGQILNVESLRNALEDCQNQSELPSSVPLLGYLTTLPRDEWYQAHQVLQEDCGEEMRRALDCIRSALCIVNLDMDDEASRTTALDDSEASRRFWHGNGVHTHNRWMDKAMQIVVTGYGQLGYIGEHSMADGMPAIGLCTHMIDEGRYDKGNHPDASTQLLQPRAIPVFESAFQSLDHKTRCDIERRVAHAKASILQRISEHELQVVYYNHHGCTAIKKAGFSPDAYAQMAMQLAGYRLFGQVVGTYEATQTRMFLHGRTETTRTVSPDALAFVQAMCDSTVDTETKRSLLEKATLTHSNYTRKAVQGRGVDRHLFGLSMLLQKDETAPDLFTHPAFLESKRWRLSTSTVPRARTGFAPVEKDGLGIGYDIQPDDCVFSITGRTETNYVKRMHDLLHEALDEMKDLFL